jgi:hypothetical protein
MTAKWLYLENNLELPTKDVDKSVEKYFSMVVNYGFYCSFVNLTRNWPHNISILYQ